MNQTDIHNFMVGVDRKRQLALNIATDFQRLVAEIDELDDLRIYDSTIAGDHGVQSRVTSKFNFDVGRVGKLPQQLRVAFEDWIKDLNQAREMLKDLDPVSKEQILAAFPILD